MEIDKVFDNASVDGVADNLFSAVRNSVSEIKAMQQRKAAENVQLVIQALKKIESDLQDKYDGVTTVIEKRVSTIKDGRDGINGRDGRDGKDGRPGKDGMPGARGRDGAPGKDGVNGMDGVSVTDARIDFDGSLIIVLSSGREINVGEVVTPDLAERIKVITNGGGTSQGVLDTLASLQAQINALDGFLDYKGTWNASTNTPTLVSSTGTKGDYYVVSVAGSTNLNGETNWGVGDWVVFNNSTWQKVDGGSTGNLTTAVISSSLTLSYGTNNGVLYLNGSKVATSGSALTFDGTTLYVNDVAVGRGAASVVSNTAIGNNALDANTTGVANTAVGQVALSTNTSGNDNVAVGSYALYLNNSGSSNTAIGSAALSENASGDSNSAFGQYALGLNTGSSNTAVGRSSGSLITTGSKNTILGRYDGNQGGLDIRTASNYIVLSDGDGNPRAYWNGANPTFPGSVTLSGGTANGVAYLNGSKVLTTGSALTFDGTNLGVGAAPTGFGKLDVRNGTNFRVLVNGIAAYGNNAIAGINDAGSETHLGLAGTPIAFYVQAAEAMRLTSSGLEVKQSQLIGYSSYAGIGTNGLAVAGNLGIGTSSPGAKLDVNGNTRLSNGTGFTSANSLIRQLESVAGASNQFTVGSIGFLTGAFSDQGQIVFSTNNSSSNTERMRLDASGNLGIGTTSPGSKLQVVGGDQVIRSLRDTGSGGLSNNDFGGRIAFGTSAGSGTGYIGSMIGVSADAAWTAGSSQPSSLEFFTVPSGSTTLTSRMRLDSSGNLGLGVTPSAWNTSGWKALEVGFAGNAFTSNAGNSSGIASNAVLTSTGWKYGVNGAANFLAVGNAGGSYAFFTAASGTANDPITFTQAMTLDASGNLAVGKTSASYRVDIAGAYQTDGGYYINGNTSGGFLWVRDNYALRFGTNDTERARITSGGYFKASNSGAYGVTNILAGTENAHQFVSNSASLPATYVSNTNGGSSALATSLPATNSAGRQIVSFVESSGANVFYVEADGDCYNTNGTYGTISDQKLKQDIVDAASQWDDLKAIRFRKYRIKSEVQTNSDAPELLGVIAQELEQVCPGLVVDSADIDKEGNDLGTTTKTVKTSVLLMKAAVALQEAMTRIEALEAQVAQLKGA